jgi:ATP-dependent helicase/nuclease subunit A
MAFPLTEEQRKIVDDRGGELLVSAAAGSGKTRVLVERLLDRVTQEGLDIDRFLVITYTKAAAAELRSRVAQELSARLAETPNDRYLRRQTTLVYQAQISTIHSFCAALLRENGHLLDLDPDFRLCDEGEAKVIMSQVLERVLDKQYEGLTPDSPFAQLADTLAAGRDDSRLNEIVLDIYSRIQSHPNPSQWLQEQWQLWQLEGVTDLAQTEWGKLLLTDARRQAARCRERLSQALDGIAGDELQNGNYGPSLSATLDALSGFLAAESWDGAVSQLPIPFPAAGRKRKRTRELSPMEEERYAKAGEWMKAVRIRCKKQLDKLAENMVGDSATLLEELSLSRPAMQALLELVEEFQQAYAAEKRRRSVMDFSDLEHFSVQLLLDKAGQPTPLAQYWSTRYDEVMVDEYQDTNQVQNAIFFAISQGGRTLFEVGDVKQSIYRFRLADPTIFLDKYRRFVPGEEAQPGQARKRVLSRNFRSRPQVLEGCNDLFRNIMSQEFGEMDYTDDQALVPGATFLEGENDALELDALDLSFLGDQEGEKADKDLLEARFVARRIRTMLEQPFQIEDKGTLRPVRPSDIMILLRSPGAVLRHYMQALGEEGIPWVSDGGVDFFNTTEVHVALAILQIVDNPHQDVALIAALRSPVYGFSADQLAMLRAKSTGDFYTALTQAAQDGDEACQRFLKELSDLRFGAGDRTCRQLIWHIYEQTNLLGIFGAMDHGRDRQNNLLSLYTLAGVLEDSGCRSLFQFLLRLERLQRTGAKLTAAPPGVEGEGVSILSIHRSKGLEKPVVLVCGLNRRLNREDLMRPVLFHPVLGVGPKGLDRSRMVEYQTLARRAVARQLEREMMAEELRLLYVAMTRAREKLILTIALPGGLDTLSRIGEELSVPVSPMALESQQSVGMWILLHALTRPEADSLRQMAHLPEVTAESFGPAWEINWVNGQPLTHPSVHEGQAADLLEETEEPPEDLAQRLDWHYPHSACVDIPSKLTATQIKGRVLDQEATEDATEPTDHRRPVTRPNFIAQQKGLTPSQRGTALHLAMQYLPLDGDHSPKGIGQELDSLTQRGFLTSLQRQAIDPKLLSAFFNSPIGREMTQASVCQREFKFSLLVPAQNYYPEAEGEEILLQGVVDAWFDNGDGVTVIDFKSDRVKPGEEPDKGEGYRPQLTAYGQALAKILNRPVRRTVLWFFATGTAVDL